MKRVAVALTLNDGVLFRTKQFQPDYRYTANFVGRDADEVFIIDVTPRNARGPDWRKNFEKACVAITSRMFVPVTVACNIRTLDDCKWALNDLGADKVLMGPTGMHNEMTRPIAERYGKQFMVGGLDLWQFSDYARDQLRFGGAQHVGEILLSDVSRDGSLQGYNIPLLQTVAASVSIPVCIQGGCGNWSHMKEAFDAGASCAVTTNIFHFTDPALRAAKQYLLGHGVDVRKGEVV